MPGEENLRVALDQRRSAGELRHEALDPPVVERQHVVLDRFDQPQPLQLVQLLGHVLHQVLRLRPVLVAVVQLPDVVVERRHLPAAHLPRCGVLGHSAPPLVVDAAVAEHLEVLCFVPLRRRGVVEAVEHARALVRALHHAVYHRRLGEAGCLEHRRREVDDVAELMALAALLRDAFRPVHDRAVARAAPVRGHLLGPLVGRVHRPRPAYCVVTVRSLAAELVELRHA